MTDQERVAVKDYIDARITPIDRDIKDIKTSLSTVITKIDALESADDHDEGASEMKATIWKAAAAIVTAVCAIGGLVIAVLT